MALDPKPNAEQLRTEELLRGFDRTRRTPRTPPVQQDFVAYHREGPPPVVRAPKIAEPTFVIPRRRPMPAWLGWIGIGAVMLVGGAFVAWLVSGPAAPREAPPPAPLASGGLVPTSSTATAIALAPSPPASAPASSQTGAASPAAASPPETSASTGLPPTPAPRPGSAAASPLPGTAATTSLPGVATIASAATPATAPSAAAPRDSTSPAPSASARGRHTTSRGGFLQEL